MCCLSFLPPATKLRQGNVFTFCSGGRRAEGLCPSMHHRSHDQGVSVQGGLCPGGPGGSLSRGSLSRGVSLQGSLSSGESLSGGGLCPVGGSLCPGGPSVYGDLCVGGLWPGGSVRGWSLSRGVSVRENSGQTPPRMVTRRWYASYWNAFLFTKSEILHYKLPWHLASLAMLQVCRQQRFYMKQVLMSWYWRLETESVEEHLQYR